MLLCMVSPLLTLGCVASLYHCRAEPVLQGHLFTPLQKMIAQTFREA